MQREYNIVIADTSCFILLDKINELALLKKLFGKITTTPEIVNEFGKSLPEWIEVKSSGNKHYQEILEVEVDGGEASAIALAIEIGDALLILDDYKARNLANKLQLNYTGTLGILLKARKTGCIEKIRPLLDKIQKTNFRFSLKILEDILKEVNE